MAKEWNKPATARKTMMKKQTIIAALVVALVIAGAKHGAIIVNKGWRALKNNHNPASQADSPEIDWEARLGAQVGFAGGRMGEQLARQIERQMQDDGDNYTDEWGRKQGDWTEWNADGSEEKGRYVDGWRQGQWIVRKPDGTEMRFKYHNGLIVE